MKFLGLGILIYFCSWQLCECNTIQNSGINPEAKIFAKYRLRNLISPDSSFHHHQIMGSGALGHDGIEDISHYLANKGMQPLKTIIYIHKEGFQATEDEGAFAQEEMAYCAKNKINFLHPFLGTHKLYIDGLNPFHIPPKESDAESRQDQQTGYDFIDESMDSIDLSGSTEAIYEALSLALNKHLQPVLIHCRAGRHRTGIIQMILRYLEGGQWTDSSKKYRGIFRAKKDKSNLIEKDDLLPLEFEYFHNAKPKARIENIQFIREFMYGEQQSHFRKRLQKLFHNSQ